MKILDKYILKSFLIPFFATFFVVLFVLVMQALWVAFEAIAGKGIGIIFILKFLYYTSLMVSAQTLPIAILLSSIMALGSLSENYEFAAAKSAGVSLIRLMRPLIVFTFLLSVLNFFFLNNVYPYAVLKQKNLTFNIKKKKPVLALVAGSFNSEIPGYQIKFDEKYGKEENFLKNVLIYDLSSGKGNKKVITAKNGRIDSEEGSKYMTLTLFDGYFYEDYVNKNRRFDQIDKMPASEAHFKEYSFNIDISSFSEEDLDDEKFRKGHNMLSLGQLNDTLPIMQDNYKSYVVLKAKTFAKRVNFDDITLPVDSLKKYNLESNILENFNLESKLSILEIANSTAQNLQNNIVTNAKNFRFQRKRVNLYDVEFYNRISFSLSCLVLFFIGAPLGSIIRKGGFGVPMIFAISIYVIYFFTNQFGRNLAEESSVTAIFGSWIAVFLMLPFCFLLTRRASKGMGIFNIDVFLQPITTFFKKTFKIRTNH